MEAILSGSVGGVNNAPILSIRAEGVPLGRSLLSSAIQCH
jgi:hypothetical protein